MRVLFINSVVDYGSTGRIVRELSNNLKEKGHEVLICYGRNKASNENDTFYFGNKLSTFWHVAMTRLFGRHGLHSNYQTHKLIDAISQFKPDIIHLHNLHGYYLNYKILFEFLASLRVKIVWTLHDCWPISGSSANFEYDGCQLWDEGCVVCNSTKSYPEVIGLKRQVKNFYLKKDLFTKPDKVIVVSPSKWLAELTRDSFLKKYKNVVINNGINLQNFKPINNSDMITKLGIKDKFIILGVANVWEERKGLKVFEELSYNLMENEVIILVGLNKKQQRKLPKNIIGIERTSSVHELAEIYSIADVFVNPTFEDNFPTTNLESLACGTPVITFNTGGSIEAVDYETGIITKKNDSTSIRESLDTLRYTGKDFTASCVKRARESYDKNDRIEEYIKLFESF